MAGEPAFLPFVSLLSLPAAAFYLVIDVESSTEGPGFDSVAAAVNTPLPPGPASGIETRRQVVTSTRFTAVVYVVYSDPNPPLSNHIGAGIHWGLGGEGATLTPVAGTTRSPRARLLRQRQRQEPFKRLRAFKGTDPLTKTLCPS